MQIFNVSNMSFYAILAKISEFTVHRKVLKNQNVSIIRIQQKKMILINYIVLKLDGYKLEPHPKCLHVTPS